MPGRLLAHSPLELRRLAYIVVLFGGLAGIVVTWWLREVTDPLVRYANPVYLVVNLIVLAVALSKRGPAGPDHVHRIEQFGFGYTVFVVVTQTLGLYLLQPIPNSTSWSAFNAVQHSVISLLLITHLLFETRRANLINATIVVTVGALSAPLMFGGLHDMLSVWSRFLIFSAILGAFFNVFSSTKEQLLRERVLSATDALTGTANRRKVAEDLDEALNAGVSVILYDLDHFKVINDDYGHGAGDTVLRDSSKIALETLAESGLPAASLGRWGGEEFLVVLPGVSLERADRLAETLRQRLCAHRFSVPQPITASFGVAARLEGESAGQLVRRADQALYQAKFSGRNIVWTSLRHHTTSLLEIN